MDLVSLRNDLEDRAAKLQRRVKKIEKDLRSPHDADSAERATERLNEPVLEALDERVHTEISELRAAIARIDVGDFGNCVDCGEPIGEARLLALPSAQQCVGCCE